MLGGLIGFIAENWVLCDICNDYRANLFPQCMLLSILEGPARVAWVMG